MRLKAVVLISLVFWADTASFTAVERGASDATAALLRLKRHPWSRWPGIARYAKPVSRLYASREGDLLWLHGTRLSAEGRDAIDELLRADSQGLDPRDYDAPELDSIARGLDTLAPASLARFDLLLTVDLVRYLNNLHSGRLTDHPLRGLVDSAPPPIDWASALSSAIGAHAVPRLVESAAPTLRQYELLRSMLAQYRRLAADTSLEPLPPVRKALPGEVYEGAPELRRRLALLGDLKHRAANPSRRYAGDLVDGVRRFQARHGLEPDGVLDQRTLAALNTPLSRRVRQIELAMERLRWIPGVHPSRLLVVNIPSFELFGFDQVSDDAAPAIQMRVVVGSALDTRTPILAEQLKYLEFHPYWNLPRTIVTDEIIPLLEDDPEYLRSRDMELIDPEGEVLGDQVDPDVLDQLASGKLWVRQRPGPQNALGEIKFAFPNTADIYLHGTPQRELFERTRRDLSHGCIRVEDPVGLAKWVFRDDPDWPPERIDSTLAQDSTRRAVLDQTIPVLLFYTTAVVRGQTLYFYEDIYGQDRSLDQALRSKRVVP